MSMASDDQPNPGFLNEYSKLQDEMRSRMSTYVAAWMSGDLDTVLSYFSDTNLDYSDYGQCLK